MIDTVYNVLDRDVEATVGVMRDVAGLFEGPGEGDKGRNLLEALNGFRVEVSSFESAAYDYQKLTGLSNVINFPLWLPLQPSDPTTPV